MTVDPSLVPQLQAAARAVEGVRAAVAGEAVAAAVAAPPGWEGGAAQRHAADLERLRALVARAATAVAAVERELSAGAAAVAQLAAAEAAAAAAAASAVGAQAVSGPQVQDKGIAPVDWGWGASGWGQS